MRLFKFAFAIATVLTMCLLVSCKDKPTNNQNPDPIITNEISLSGLEYSPQISGGVFVGGDSIWVFVYDTINKKTGKSDTVKLGPFEGYAPFGDNFEYFPANPKTDKDDRWVLEYLSPEGCKVVIIGFVNGKLKVIKEYLLKNANCGNTVFDKDLKKKTIYGPAYGGDSTEVIIINYFTGDLLARRKLKGTNFADVEVINGKLVKITQTDTVYIDVEVTTDIKKTFGFPGKFDNAKEDGKNCKMITVKNGMTFYSYILCPDSPLTKISTGTPLNGDSISDVQAHTFKGDTTRFVLGAYDKVNDITRINLMGKDGTPIAQQDIPGNLKARLIICGDTKAFICEDPDGARGEGNITLGGFNLRSGKKPKISPIGATGKVVKVEPSTSPCGVKITIKDANGDTRTQVFEFKY